MFYLLQDSIGDFSVFILTHKFSYSSYFLPCSTGKGKWVTGCVGA